MTPKCETRGPGWGEWSSRLLLSPDRTRLLYGTKESDKVSLWCYDLPSARKTKLVENVSDTYPVWIDQERIGFFEEEHEDVFVIARIDEKGELQDRSALNLTTIPAPLLPKDASASQPAETPAAK